ncbi:hypothetical protein DF019_13940 [Burkholderia cenocepacia]|nr:hypothetical protein DF133_04780 [Burkholderia cenocepacia]RQV89425.1 hypothetical protein DF019_13940 [Burkholderia cenocepacia]
MKSDREGVDGATERPLLRKPGGDTGSLEISSFISRRLFPVIVIATVSVLSGAMKACPARRID